MSTMNQVSLSQTTDLCVICICLEDAVVGIVDVRMWQDYYSVLLKWETHKSFTKSYIHQNDNLTKVQKHMEGGGQWD